LAALWLTWAGGSRTCAAQRPQDPADALRSMFERMGQQSAQFMPGMFSELTDQQMAELERVPISPREESQFGSQVLKSYEASLRSQNVTITRKGDDVPYLTRLIDAIRPHMSNAARYPKIDVGLVQTDSVDAYSIPGGHLLFTTGLMQNVQSEAELVGVIAHELSHLDRGHQLLQLRQLKTAGKVSDFRSGMLWMATLAKPMRPEFEAQADADAVRWMLAAGYDPRQLARLLNRWDVLQDQTAPWTRMLPSFARSHPDSGRRAQSVLADFDRAGIDPSGLIVGEENLAKRQPAAAQAAKP
jgi:predicted Zn-dependent protease